jgi:hypothetical protein
MMERDGFIYPLRLGRKPGTIKLRIDFFDGSKVVDTIHIDPEQNGHEWKTITVARVWEAWEAMSVHKRLAFIAAASRARTEQIPSDSGPATDQPTA